MNVVAPENASTCRSKSAEGERVEKVNDYVIASDSPKGQISFVKVVEDFEPRPHKAVLKEKRRCRNGTSSSCQRCCLGIGGRKVARKKHKRKRQRRRRARQG